MLFKEGWAASIQLCSGPDVEKNLGNAARWMTLAVERGARLLVLPENFSFLGRHEAEKRQHREDPETGASVLFLREFAARHRVWIVGGSIPFYLEGEDRIANGCLLVGEDGRIVARYDKIHLFDVRLGEGETFQESDFVRPGNQVVVADTPFGRLGLTICYDLRFPELYRQLSAQEATILTVVAAFIPSTGKDHWEVLLRARAVENFSYVLASGQWGRHPGGRQSYGRSLIVEPWGVVTACCADAEGFALASLDPQRIHDCRSRIPALSHRVLSER
ncbi:MAG: carbon-nitrogen hydrolase family protein [Magnetococcus sp. DMHC-6]